LWGDNHDHGVKLGDPVRGSQLNTTSYSGELVRAPKKTRKKKHKL